MRPSPLVDRLRAAFPEASGRSVKQWLAAGRVRVDGVVVRDGRAPVGAGAAIALGGAVRSRAPFPHGLRLVHEDDHILVIDKPPGLLTIATDAERARTAYRMLWNYLASQRPPRRPFIVHRLDRETSGLLVFAKSVEAKRRLQAQFEARAVERVYAAVVEGSVRAARGTLTSALTQDRALRVRAAPGPVAGGSGKEAITHYRVVERRADSTRLELTLGTGRRHQIRVQLAALGHPIVGDRAHGSRRDPLRRLCLHASRLGFAHPATGAPARFESPAPPAFARARTAV